MIRVTMLSMTDQRPPIPETDLDNDLSKANQNWRIAAGCYGIGRVTSDQLLGGLRELEIVHEGSLYRLRITSTGKLILTK